MTDIMGLASSTEDDMLEKMLKEAEVLAARMATIELGKSSSSSSAAAATQPLVDNSSQLSNSSDHSKLTVDKLDPLLQKAEYMVQQVKEQNTAPVVEPKASLARQLAESKESLEQLSDLDEILRQSETLLQKMRSKNSVASPEINDTATSTATSHETPSSVYLLQSNLSGLDDVSSVGSASLRASASHVIDIFNASSEALNASKLMADSVKEITEEYEMDSDDNDLPHTPSTPTPRSPEEDRVPVMDYSPRSPERPTRSVISRSSTNSSKEAARPVLQTIIPDFTITAADTQWEKVYSAKMGDQDFVPLRDFSEEPRKEVTTQPFIIPTKQSRLATYRGEAKRRKRRQQRAFKAVAVGAVLAIYFVWSRSGGDSSTSQISVSDPTTITQEEVPISLVEEISETIEEPPMDEEPIVEPEDIEESQVHDDVEVDAQEQVDIAAVEQEEEVIVEESPELDLQPEPTIQVAAPEEPIDDEKRFCKNLLEHIVSTPCCKLTKRDLLTAALL
jgi:hypothetical protein